MGELSLGEQIGVLEKVLGEKGDVQEELRALAEIRVKLRELEDREGATIFRFIDMVPVCSGDGDSAEKLSPVVSASTFPGYELQGFPLSEGQTGPLFLEGNLGGAQVDPSNSEDRIAGDLGDGNEGMAAKVAMFENILKVLPGVVRKSLKQRCVELFAPMRRFFRELQGPFSFPQELPGNEEE